MNNVAYTPSLEKLGIKTNKDILNGQLLSLYRVHRAGQSHGNGLFANRNIFKNEVVIQAIGPIVGPEVSSTLYLSYGIDILIQVGMDKWILPNNESRFINHSCEPNLGRIDKGIFIAMRNISAGEELSFDYGTIDIESAWSIDCLCKTKSCHGVISGFDVFNPTLNLAEKYKGYLQKYVLKEIRKRAKNLF